MNKAIRIISIIGILLIAVLVILVVIFFCIHTGKIREYKDENGNALPGSLSEKLVLEINGAKNGLFINSKNIDNPVLLFVSSGPGTDDYFFCEKYPDMHLEDEYTVCYWDYRGMGIAYDSSIDPDTITSKVLAEDTVAVTEYLKSRFSKEKVYIMGFSGGSKIALAAAAAHPELYHAYIGMAQVVATGEDNDTLMYDFMKKTFTDRNDKSNLKKLDSLVDFKENGKVMCKDWYEYVYLLHEAGGGTTMNETEFTGIDIPIMLSHCYTANETINYIRGMKMYRKSAFHRETATIDYRKQYTYFDLPVFFLSGDHDYNCPWPLVEEYNDIITAPDKEFYLIKDAAHSPLWEQQQASFEVMVDIKYRTKGK